MANRSMEAKRQKIKRMKRTFPKSYCSNYIPVGNGPNREVMGDYKERARGLAFDAEYLQWLEANTRFKGKTPTRLEVEANIQVKAHLQRIEDVAPTKMCFTLMNNSILRVRAFFNSERTLWVIMEENFRKGTIRTSMTYSSKDSIVHAWRKDKLRWVSFSTERVCRKAPAPPLPTV